jgi:anti-sigma factor RsiW
LISGLFARHVTRWLSAYHEGVLPAVQASRVAAHLLACQRCNRELGQVRTGARLAARLRPVRQEHAAQAGPSWSELARLLDTPPAPRAVAWRWIPAAALAFIVVAAAAWHRGPVPRAAIAGLGTLEEAAVAAHEQEGADLDGDNRIVRRWIAGQPVTLLVANAPGTGTLTKSIATRTTADGLRVASWTRDDRRYVLVSRLAGETACTICHTTPPGTVL